MRRSVGVLGGRCGGCIVTHYEGWRCFGWCDGFRIGGGGGVLIRRCWMCVVGMGMGMVNFSLGGRGGGDKVQGRSEVEIFCFKNGVYKINR